MSLSFHRLGVGDVGNVVLRDRRILSEDGILIVVATLENEHVIAGPEIVSRGFVYVRESDALLEEARELVREILENCERKNINDWGKIKNLIRDDLHEFVWKKTKRRPMILPIFMEI
jgi:ribonuclease J